MSDKARTAIFPGWPVYLALGLAGLLIAGMIGLDAQLDRQVSAETAELTDHRQRAIVLLDRIRARGEDLHRGDVTEIDRASLGDAIATYSREYDSLVTNVTERAEWTHAQELLRGLMQTPLDDNTQRRALAKQLNATIDRLMLINETGGRSSAARIREAHSEAIQEQLAAAMIVIVIIAGTILVARQRRRIAMHVAALAEKNEDLEAFAERAAHNLRSPMNPIRGYADLIIESKDEPDEVEQMARRIRTAVDRMARVVDDMLALSVAGRPPPGESSTTEVITAMLEELGPELHGVTLTRKLGAGKVACSAGVLGQILRCLVGNALKYRERSRALTLAVETREVDSFVEIAIADNGVGMDSETAARAFEPHFRGRTDREVPGHGLGLAIVERATRALGGTCALESVLDDGTRIVVRLPRAR